MSAGGIIKFNAPVSNTRHLARYYDNVHIFWLFLKPFGTLKLREQSLSLNEFKSMFQT